MHNEWCVCEIPSSSSPTGGVRLAHPAGGQYVRQVHNEVDLSKIPSSSSPMDGVQLAHPWIDQFNKQTCICLQQDLPSSSSPMDEVRPISVSALSV